MDIFKNLAQVGNAAEFGVGLPLFSFFLILFWIVVWKGYALWTAAKRGQKWWFVILLITNTLAILDLIYIFFVAKKKDALVALFKKKVLKR